MNTHKLGVLECDGIGPEVVRSAVDVLKASAEGIDDLKLDLESLPVGWDAIRKCGVALPDSTLEALRGCHGWILGPHDSQSYPPAEKVKLNPSGVLRKQFDLYANVRPARAYPGLPAVRPGLDVVIARENTEGLYADRNMAVGSGEFMPTPDIAMMVGFVTRRASERIAHVAFRLARNRKKRVSIVHKANVLTMTSGLFREACRSVASLYPDVVCDDWHIDAMTAHLVRHGQDFDVLVAENMFGDILSDLTGELSGSLGMAGSINAGDEVAMAQAAHGSAPDIAGMGIANPIGMVKSVAMLMDWLGEKHEDGAARIAARRIDLAIEKVLGDGVTRTPDLGGSSSTEDVTEALVAAVRRSDAG